MIMCPAETRDKLIFKFRGKAVTVDQFLDACDAEEDKYFAARKPIWVHQGVTNLPNTWRQKWIKK